MIVQRQPSFLKFFPVEVLFSMPLFDHGNAIVHRADQLAQIAADAFGLLYRIAVIGMPEGELNRLMRGILAGNIAKSAVDTLGRIDARDDMIIHVEVFPIRECRDGLADKIGGADKAFFIHPVAKPLTKVFDDTETLLHHGGAYLNTG